MAPEIPNERAAQTIEDGGGSVCFAFALRVRLESQENQAAVGRVAAEAETGDGEGALDLRDAWRMAATWSRRCSVVYSSEAPGGRLDRSIMIYPDLRWERKPLGTRWKTK